MDRESSPIPACLRATVASRLQKNETEELYRGCSMTRPRRVNHMKEPWFQCRLRGWRPVRIVHATVASGARRLVTVRRVHRADQPIMIDSAGLLTASGVCAERCFSVRGLHAVQCGATGAQAHAPKLTRVRQRSRTRAGLASTSAPELSAYPHSFRLRWASVRARQWYGLWRRADPKAASQSVEEAHLGRSATAINAILQRLCDFVAIVLSTD